MARYQDTIRRHSEEVNRLHAAVHETVKYRDKSQSHREEWLKAAALFRNHHSSIDNWMQEIEGSEICDWQNAREFVFQYLTVDPVYFRSGYAKEMLVKKLKKCVLTNEESQILRTLIVNRIQSGGQREFKKFCQLIPKIQNEAFNEEVIILANAKDSNVASRGKIALRYLIKD